MKFDIIAPKLYDGVEPCKLIRWHKADSAAVDRGDLIATLETDKAICEIEAEFSGVLYHALGEGSAVNIGNHFGCIEHDGSEVNKVINELKQKDLGNINDLDNRNWFHYLWKVVNFALILLGIRYMLDYVFQ